LRSRRFKEEGSKQEGGCLDAVVLEERRELLPFGRLIESWKCGGVQPATGEFWPILKCGLRVDALLVAFRR
jgi:hypothetical protein